MSGSGNSDNTGFEAAMQRYWQAWTQSMPAPGAASAGAEFPWRESIEQWTRLMATDTPAEVQELGARFQHQAGDWLGTMQQVAARFAGRDSSAAEVAAAWQEAVQGQDDDLLHWMLGAARGGNALDDQPWIRDWVRAAQTGFSNEWSKAPAFGPAREHQARWQALLKMQQEYQARAETYVDAIRTVLEDAFKRFEGKLSEHEAPGSQLTSARAMFDLWIDAAEEAYAKMALSDEYQRIYAELANAQMRLRAASQSELERACEMMGMPTRSEMDSAHRRIAELERQLRRLLETSAANTHGSTAADSDTRPAAATAGKAAGKPAAKAADKPATRPAAKTTKATKATSRPAGAGKTSTPRRGGKP